MKTTTRNEEMNFIVVSLNARSGIVADSLAGYTGIVHLLSGRTCLYVWVVCKAVYW